MLLYCIPGTDPFFNLALEEYLLSESRHTWLLLWRNAPTVVVGRHQNTLEAINRPFVEANAIHVVRRLSGGGAVYHDMCNVNFSFITTVKAPAAISMEPFVHAMVGALQRLGVPANVSGRNDIEADGHKISDNAQTLHGQRLLHHGTLLFDSNLSILTEALRVQPEKVRSRAVKSAQARVGNLCGYLAPGLTVEAFMEDLMHELVNGSEEPLWNVARPADEAGLAAIRRLRDARYATREWTFGHSPAFDRHNGVQTDGGYLECLLTVREGLIEQCTFYGDFMALLPVEPVAEALRGCRLEREAVERVLAGLPLARHFGSIGVEEVTRCLLGLTS